METFRAILQKTFRRQQFTLTDEEAIALFMKYGHDAHGDMPYEMFARRIFTGQGHQLSLEGCKKKAFDASDDTDWAWQGMIKYPHCRSGVFAPSDWEDYRCPKHPLSLPTHTSKTHPALEIRNVHSD
jgi:hypothetical protein